MTKNKPLPLLIALSAACIAVSLATVSYTDSDPKGTLLVSQALLEKGTIQLDHYGPDVLKGYGWQIYKKKNGHFYYFFPLGTSLAAFPFVVVANACGLDMVDSEAQTQRAIDAVAAVLLLLMLYRVARLHLSCAGSVVLATLCWFGSPFASTAGTALWSHNFAALFALLAIHAAITASRLGSFGRWPLIACSLFAAYLCRPTMAVLAACMLLFLFVHEKKAAIKTALLLLLLLTFFIMFSFREFGQMLPDYYLPQRIEGGQFLTALFGNLFSPSRGLFIFSPFLLLPFFFMHKMRGLEKKGSAVLLIGLAWPLAHLVLVSLYPHWWAGVSFGPRFMTDALPGLFALLCLAVSLVSPRSRIPAVVFLAIAGCFSIYVHCWQGLYNPCTAQWNTEPSIDAHPEYLFDWNYPQFLHDKQSHEQRLLAFQKKSMEQLSPGQILAHNSTKVVFWGWSEPEDRHRWSEGGKVKIFFAVVGTNRFAGKCRLVGSTLGRQNISISLNGSKINEAAVEGYAIAIVADIPSGLLKEGDNELEILLPNARRQKTSDPRMLGFALQEFVLY